MDFNPQRLPMLSLDVSSLDVGPQDFDYGVFLQEDDDVDYMRSGESPASDPSSHARSGGSPARGFFADLVAPAPASAATRAPLGAHSPGAGGAGSSSGTSPPKHRLERRGHRKSRLGCHNCKRRRIKCQETRPACGHCIKTGLQCVYPQTPQVNYQPQHQIPLFSLQDMRFFQHFLFKCYPHQPIGNAGIWTHEIPCLSQNHEYLMHAVLGLAASDLMRGDRDPSLEAAALAHRLKAIKAVKKALADVPKVTDAFSDQGNALMATCYALTFQSVMLDDGMAEFMTFVRGIIIVALHMYLKGAKFVFHDFLGEDQLDKVRPMMEKLPLINREWTDMAAHSVRGLEPLCRGDDTAHSYYKLILNIVEELYTSPFGAYKAISKHYGWWMQLPHEQFRAVVDPDNQVFLLLGSHWIAIKQIMQCITETEYAISKGDQQPQQRGDMDAGMLRWLRHLNRQIRPDFRPLNHFPLWVEAQLDKAPSFFGRTM